MPHDQVNAEILHRRLIPAGHIIFRADEPGLSAFLIRSGVVEIYKQHGGADVTIALLQPGEIFGEMALFNAGRRSTFARARTTCELALISGNKIERLITDAAPGVRALVRMLVRRLADLNDQIEVCPETARFRMKAG